MGDQQNGNGHTDNQQAARAFNPNEHLIQIKGHNGMADYLPVQWRLVWFRSVYPHGSVETEMLHFDPEREVEAASDIWSEERQHPEKLVKRGKGLAVFKATVKDGQGGIGTGTKSETAANFPDFIEAAETGAIGRALASLGFGTQFAPELQEEHRIVDSPVTRSQSGPGNERRPATPIPSAKVAERRPAYTSNGNNHANGSTQRNPEQPMTESQLASIRTLCERLGRGEPANVHELTHLGARELIAQLSQEYRLSQNKAS